MKFRNYSKTAYFVLIVLGIAGISTAQAQQVAVKSADPNTAEQATVNLDVKITGRGFSSGANVAFFVTGTTNPGGITVNAVTVHGSKNLTANIDVAADAEIADFDIEVSLSSGRRGRGTTLFSVQPKTNGAPDNTIHLHFEPLNGVNSAGLLTRHDVVWIHDYTVRNGAAGCPSEFNNTIWTVRTEWTSSKSTITYAADGSDQIIDVLAAGVGFDGCYGATSVSNGALVLTKEKVGKGKRATCEGRFVWTFGHQDTANGIEYFTLRSTGPRDDGLIPLTGPPGSNLSDSQLCDKNNHTSLVIDGNFEFTQTNDSGTFLLGDIGLAFYVVFHYPCCLPEA